MTRQGKGDGSRLEHWVEPLTLRGRWGRVDSSNKGFVDRSTVDDVVPAFAAEFGLQFSNIREGSDPPDIVVCEGGRDVGVELVEFLNKTVREKKAARQPVAFEERLWTEEGVVSQLNSLLDKKHARYAAREDQFVADVLLIHSCELWLNAGDVAVWLSRAVFEARPTIRSAYFALEPLPDFNKAHWPLFRLYGSRP